MTLPATTNRKSLVEKFSDRFSIEPNKLMNTLKATAFKVKDGEVSNEQMAALLVVADQYGLNPFTKEIYAFPDKQNGIVPVVGVDGWARLINDHPDNDGIEFEYAKTTSTMPDAKSCPDWVKCKIHRKDKDHPVEITEYLDECYQPKRGNFKGPWQTHTKRMLRHKALIQCARIAYGYSGIYDEDEAQRISESTVIQDAVLVDEPESGTERVMDALAGQADPEVPEKTIDVDQWNELITLAGQKGFMGPSLRELAKEKCGHGTGSIEDLSVANYEVLMASLKRRKDVGPEQLDEAPE